jgi:hypothetical protein
MEAPPSQHRRPIEVGRVIDEVFAIYRAHAAPLILSALAVFTAFGVLQALIENAGGDLAPLLAAAVNLVGVALYTGFVVKLVEDIRDGQRDFSVGELFSSAYPAVGPLIVNGILLGLGVLGGLILLVVPGLYLLTIWAVCSPAIVAEGRSPVEAFRRSRHLVEGQGWPVFGALVVAILIQVVVGIIFALIGAGAGDGVLIALSIAAAALTAPISGLVATVMFYDLGGGRPETPPENTQVVIEY